MAVPWLLRPYKWQTHFIPFLPPSFSDFLSAPVPFIAGVLSAPLAGYDDDVAVLRVAEDRVSLSEMLFSCGRSQDAPVDRFQALACRASSESPRTASRPAP